MVIWHLFKKISILKKNSWRLFHVSPQFPFITSEMELDYYHQKLNKCVTYRVIERLNTQDLRKLEKFKKKLKFYIKGFFIKCDQIPWKLRIWSHLLKKFFMENFIFLCSDFPKISEISDLNASTQPTIPPKKLTVALKDC